MKGRWITFLLLAVPPAGCTSSPATLERNRALVRHNAAAYNARDIGGLVSTMAPDLRRHCQATPGVDVRSVEDFIAFAESGWSTFFDSNLAIDQIVAERDRVAVYGTFTGVQEGPMGPFPVSGRPVELDFAGVFRIENERIAEVWITWDNLAALTQLGHWRPPEVEQEVTE